MYYLCFAKPTPKMATITKIKEIEQNVIKISKILDYISKKNIFGPIQKK